METLNNHHRKYLKELVFPFNLLCEISEKSTASHQLCWCVGVFTTVFFNASTINKASYPPGMNPNRNMNFGKATISLHFEHHGLDLPTDLSQVAG